MNKPLESLMQKDVTRQEFLLTLGFGLASVMGFSHIIQFLSGKNSPTHKAGHVESGYGDSFYGK